MHYFTFPDKDTTIYSNYVDVNTGLDELVEINKDTLISGNAQKINNSRILMKFDIEPYKQFIVSKGIRDAKFFLNLFPSSIKKFPTAFQLELIPLAKDWEAGYGKKIYNYSSDAGATWRNADTNIPWQNQGADYLSEYGIITDITIPSFNLRLDVTELVNLWMFSSVSNNGFIIKKTDADEINNRSFDSLKLYSMDTNTIFVPKLEMCYADSVYMVDSLQEFTDIDQIYVYMPHVKDGYAQNSTVRFKVNARDTYPEKKFIQDIPYNSTVDEKDLYAYNDIKWLPKDSYYSVKDCLTEQVIIPFSEYSRISRSQSGNYFDMNLTGFMPKRFYEISFKIEMDGHSIIAEKKYKFEVTK